MSAHRRLAKQMPRVTIPARSTDQPVYASYRAYKPQLRIDFMQSCGYCGDEDRFYGGLHGYQVDHFAPHSRFPTLLTTYANLVYACPYCNRGKSNTWVGMDAAVSHDGEEGFVDPCLPAFDDHIDRDAGGNFTALTPVGSYMIKHLRLYLARHRYIWTIRKLQECADRAERLRHLVDKSDKQYVPLLEMIADVNAKIKEYNDSVFDIAA